MNVQPHIDQFLPLRPAAPRPRTRGRARLAGLALLALCAAIAGARYLYPYATPGEIVRATGLSVELRGPGTLTALSQASVGSRLQGRISALAVDRNDTVTEGEILARLAFEDLAGEVASAEANAHAAERAIAATEAERDRAVATLDKVRAIHERQQALLAKGVISEAGLEDALATRRQAEADLVHARRAIEQAEAERDAARARIAVARAQLDDSLIRAPISGIVVARTHQLGEVLTPGTELLRIVDPTSLVLTARLDESAIAALRPGQEARVTFGPDQPPIPGHVLRLDRQVDEETREFELDITLDSLPPNWALGQRGTARIVIAQRPDALTVPKSFIDRRDGHPGLWVATDGRARWREVGLGAAGSERVEISRGLVSGDTVLAPQDVYPLMRVRLSEATP
ncbi:efflux RND transporter periplasmic adaptor subunit [Ancylobacter pratisalsi]|uniref:Efflux RND transporter periplasmic adaptor subunit n=1 Tax=Ancylobacter pratisalsi TaxID=1745854 RepID=A0A6P1YQY8_9HYPH|nr:efflux RND transporter periplasmic adaptor subunit [Ancylobacter pratisalsi]QIB35201.1 efflux RND transporter periplasmic adaptor subunit [Ancylobacter pratisalsi]